MFQGIFNYLFPPSKGGNYQTKTDCSETGCSGSNTDIKHPGNIKVRTRL